MLVDAAALSVAAVIAPWEQWRIPHWEETTHLVPWWLPTAILVAWLWGLATAGAYSYRLQHTGAREYTVVATTSALVAGGTAMCLYLGLVEVCRGYLVGLLLVGFAGLLAVRLVRRSIIGQLHRRGLLLLPVIVAGDPARVDEVAQALSRARRLGYRVVGAVTDRAIPRTPDGVEVIGCLSRVVELASERRVHAVVFTEGAFRDARDFRHLAWELEDRDTITLIAPALTDICPQRVHAIPVAGLPLLHIGRPHARRAGRRGKRIFDVSFATLCLLLSAPVMALTVAAIRLEDGGPALFRQQRIGRRGKPFECLKLRSMVMHAEAGLADLQSQNEGAGPLFKLARDPRITRVGHFIRRYSIDELPQLWNVLRGDMSLVGPRPALPSEVARYAPDTSRRLDVRPGLTGLWQVSGRSDLAWDEAVRLDVYYVDNWSFAQDLAIIGRTVRAVLSAGGAY